MKTSTAEQPDEHDTLGVSAVLTQPIAEWQPQSRYRRISAVPMALLATFAFSWVIWYSQKFQVRSVDSDSASVLVYLRPLVAFPPSSRLPAVERNHELRSARTRHATVNPQVPQTAKPVPPQAVAPVPYPLEDQTVSPSPGDLLRIDDAIVQAAAASAARPGLAERATRQLQIGKLSPAEQLHSDVDAAKKRDCLAPNPNEGHPLVGAIILLWTAASGRCAGL